MKKILHTVFSRTTFMILMVVLEAAILYSLFRWFGKQAAWIEEVLRFLSVVIVLAINRYSRHLSADMIWILVIILFPVPGALLYLLLGANLISSRTYKGIHISEGKSKKYYPKNDDVLDEMCASAPELRGQFRYIANDAGFPFYRNTGFEYYGLGDTGYPVMLEELKKAEKFIFLEYFIIEEGEMWNGILEILEEKAKAGLDVRVLYDDLGSFMTLSFDYAKKLEEKGIKCIPFNRINPIVGIVMNHRDHRKIMVIDGKTAFSGGVNLADEYINVKVIHGHWKDNIIRVTGEAVWSYTVMFLTHWNALSTEKDVNFEVFRVKPARGKPDGYIAPYGETPLDNEITAQNIYESILNQANDYCYIYTPYLIIDTDLINTLILTAKRGVDVRIMTPGIPDKRIVWDITRSYYYTLIQGGVKIFEYTPGFVHSKVFVADDRIAAVGTINLDYRSLYLHFENGTYLYNSKKILDVKKDYQEALSRCNEISLEESRTGPFRSFLISVLRLFASQM